MPNLETLRSAAYSALATFEQLLSARFPGADKWTWYRAHAATRNENIRRNPDTSRDAALAADPDLTKLHAEYIRLLHVFYRARDGEYGVLGSRGL